MGFAVAELSAMEKIPERLKVYRELIDAAEPLFKLGGKGLERSCAEHAQNLMFYDLMLQECKTIEQWTKVKVGEVEGRLYKALRETRNISLSSTDIRAYIGGMPEYVKAQEVFLDVVHVKSQLQAIVEALQSMAFSLNNIVKLRVAQLEHVVL